jgi:antitoxin PrlF
MDERVTKAGVAERLLTRPGGATMREIIAATGGPQYNELRRLEGRGYSILRVKEGNETRYFARAPQSPSFEAMITSKGQVTIPKEIRAHLRLGSGHKVRFTIEDGSRVVIVPVYKRLSELADILPRPKRSATLEEIDEGIRRAAAERYLRAVGRKE